MSFHSQWNDMYIKHFSGKMAYSMYLIKITLITMIVKKKQNIEIRVSQITWVYIHVLFLILLSLSLLIHKMGLIIPSHSWYSDCKVCESTWNPAYNLWNSKYGLKFFFFCSICGPRQVDLPLILIMPSTWSVIFNLKRWNKEINP